MTVFYFLTFCILFHLLMQIKRVVRQADAIAVFVFFLFNFFCMLLKLKRTIEEHCDFSFCRAHCV